ncbi:MAG: T9SS type A sorting domain-containing protein [Bacteroidetes bacterium]|nr:T9SS type A sorting domain-containing protein [Bacteroidota bacterium]
MKRFLILFLALVPIICLSQAKIGMSHSYTITPVAASSPTSGVLYGDSVHIYSFVKNSGNALFTGSVKLQVKRDTTNGVKCDSVAINVFLQPNDSVLTLLTFAPAPGIYAFKSGGNGNTIVVWPFVIDPSVLPGDSIKTTIWISGTAGIHEFDLNPFKLYPNPASQFITIKAQKPGIYKTMILYDVFARKIKELDFEEQVDVSDLKPGTYWIMIHTKDTSYRISFIKEGTAAE